MPEIHDYIKYATLNFKIAAKRFEETEDILLSCKKRLEDCTERLRNGRVPSAISPPPGAEFAPGKTMAN